MSTRIRLDCCNPEAAAGSALHGARPTSAPDPEARSGVVFRTEPSVVRLPLRSLLHSRCCRALRHDRSALTAEGHSPRRRVNGSGADDHETSSAGAERNRPAARRAGCPTRLASPTSHRRRFLAKATTWPDFELSSRNQRARCRTGSRPPTSAIDSKLEHTHERSSPRLSSAFHTREWRGRRAPVTRLAPSGARWLPSWRQPILRTDQPITDSV